jgi:hypothetical protein
MNEMDPLVLYTDASTKAIGGVLMQVQNGVEKPCVFVSHVLSDQATRWGIMELELYALVHCVKQLAPYLLGRPFIVKTDHKNLLYLSNSTIPKLVRWRVILSEYQFVISHLPGKDNVVADGLTRVFRCNFNNLSVRDRRFVKDDTIPRIFRLEGEGITPAEEPVSDSDEEGQAKCPSLSLSERVATFSKFHNSCVGHFGVTKTLQALALSGHSWKGMSGDVQHWIRECGICQKVKYQRNPGWQDEFDHHLYSMKPLASLSVDTLGPLPEDDEGNKYIVVIVDNFSKFVGLYPNQDYQVRRLHSGIRPMGRNLRGPRGDQNGWRISVHVQYGGGFTILVAIQALKDRGLSSSGQWISGET